MEPITIQDSPIPLLDGTFLESFGRASNPSDDALIDKYSDKRLPNVVLAQELRSQSFDSATKRIKGAYEFESLGSLTVGQYQQGLSGQISISADGIQAINSDGEPTIDIDGENGDATFFGRVLAEGFDVIDETGLISLNNFIVDDVFSVTPNNTNSTSFVDVPGSSVNPLVLSRSSQVLVGLMAYGRNDSNISSQGADQGLAHIYDDFVAGGLIDINFPGQSTTQTPDGLSFSMDVWDIIYARTGIVRMDAGTHNLKLQYMSINGGISYLNAFEIFYVVLGN